MVILFQKWDVTILSLAPVWPMQAAGLQRRYIKSIFTKHHLAISNPALLWRQKMDENIEQARKYVNNNNGSCRHDSAMSLLSKSGIAGGFACSVISHRQ